MILNNLKICRHHIIRIILLIFLLINSSFVVIYSQDNREKPPPIKERIFFGGNLGLQLGTYTDIQIAPIVGLWLLPRLNVAVGPDYRYYKVPYYRTNVYGGKGYVEFVLIKNLSAAVPITGNTGIFLHLEDELLSLESSFWKDPDSNGRFYLNTVLAGAGLSQQIGRRSSLNFMALWALNDSGYGVYTNPEIRISFNF